MAYKTLLTVLSDESQMPLIDAAVSLARAEDAHLAVFCLGIDHTQIGYYYAGASAYVLQESIDRAMEAASAVEARVRDKLDNEDIRWSVESAVAQTGGVSALIGLRARFADLAILAKPYGSAAAGDAEIVVEAALFEGDCPVLIVPETGLSDNFRQRVLVGWNQSSEAMVACRRALPFLRRAEAVEIAVVEPSPNGPEGSEPGGMLAKWLNRHGIKTDVAVLPKTLPRISEILNRRAIETGASMIVMGAYGHSRFREAILGGATRNMLEQAQVPVFMAR